MADFDTAMDAATADIGANLVAVLVIVTALLATMPDRPQTAPEITAQPAAPLSGQAQSDLLRQRLIATSGPASIELTDAGAFLATPMGQTLLSRDTPLPAQATVFIFSNRHYAQLQTATTTRTALSEITVPDALRASAPRLGASAFSPDFLALPANPPEAFRPALLRLLTHGSRAGTAFVGLGPEGATNRFASLFHTAALALNLACFALTVWALHRLSRRLQL